MKVQVILLLVLSLALVQTVEVSRRRKGVHHHKIKKQKTTKGGNTVEIEKTRVEIKSASKPKVNEAHDSKAPFQLNVVSKNKSMNVQDAL